MTALPAKLEVNRDLSNNHFDSYRYDRQAKYSVFAEKLPDGCNLHHFKLNHSTDYSYCHAAMSSSINNLFHSQFDPSKVYLISDKGAVLAAALTQAQDASAPFELKPMFTIPDLNTETMHASLSFPSPTHVLVLLSSRHLRKVAIQKSSQNTEHLDRYFYKAKLFILKRVALEEDSETWEFEYAMNITQKCLYSGLNLIGSSHLHLFDSTQSSDGALLRIIIGSVHESFQLNSGNNALQLKSRFGAIFHLIQLQQIGTGGEAKWAPTESKRFIENARASNDFPKYISLANNDDNSVVIVSQNRLKYNALESIHPDQLCCPTEDDLNDEILLKATEELVDQTVVDPETLKEVEREETEAIRKAKFTKAAFEEYEACDLPEDSANSLVMTRFDSQTGQVLSEYDLSAYQWLFSVTNYSTHNRLPFLVMRFSNDVDAFVYEPQLISPFATGESGCPHPSSNASFAVKHLDSFPAFGYVYASKQYRRFATFCQQVSSSSNSVEFNTAVIDNSMDKMLYCYCKPSSDGSNMKPSSGQQLLFHLDQPNCTAITKSSPLMIHGLRALPNFDGSTAVLPKHSWKGAIYIVTDDALCLVQF